MFKAEFLVPLPNGELISYEEAFSPFTVYNITTRQSSYLLIPTQDQKCLQNIIIVANEVGIRICQHKGWPKMFVSKLLQILECKDQNQFRKIYYNHIPIDIQGLIVDNLIKQIQYTAT